MSLDSKNLVMGKRLADFYGRTALSLCLYSGRVALFIFFGLTNVFHVYGQKEVNFKAFGYIPDTLNDSLYSELKSAKSEKDKLPILYEIAKAYSTYGNSDSLIHYSKAINSIALSNEININQPLHLVRAKYLLGEGKYLNGLYDASLKAYVEGISQLEKSDTTLISYQLKLGLGKVYIRKQMYQKAYDLLKNCAAQLEYNSLAAEANLYLGISYLNQEDLDTASSYFETARRLSNTKAPLKLTLQIAMARALLAVKETNYDRSLNLLEGVIDKSLKNNLFDLYTEAVVRYGSLSRDLENYQVSEMTLSTAYANAMQWNRLDLQKDIINSLRKTYAAKGDYQNAYNLMTQYTLVSKEITQQQNSKAIQELEFKYQTLQKESQIFELKKEQLAKQAEIDRQKTIKKAFLYGFLVLLIPITALLFVYYQKLQTQSKLNLQQKELNTRKISGLLNEQELNLAKTALEAQQEERTRISQQLHDSIGGNLAGIKLQLGNLENDNPLQKEIVSQVNETYELVRDISHDLVPKKFNQHAFSILISEYIQKIENGSQMKVAFLVHPKDKINDLKELLKVELYQIIQELLTNTIKHASAENVELNVTVFENMVQVLFEDDGVGFETSKAKKGIGLSNIENRLQLLKAHMNLDSSIGRGTVITIEIPLKNKT
ncbi:MAG: ATP-binding protein [Maribacter sp.]